MDPRNPSQPSDFTDAAELTGRRLDGVGRGFGEVVRVFHEVVGADLARMATPVKLRRDHKTGEQTLVVRCVSASWAQQIGFMELDLLDRLRSALPAFTATRIHARAGAPAPRPVAPPPPELTSLTPERAAYLTHLTETISDPELRARVLAAALAAERRRLTPPQP